MTPEDDDRAFLAAVIRHERNFLAGLIAGALGHPDRVKAPPDSAGRLLFESPAGRFKVVLGPCSDADWDAGEPLTVPAVLQPDAEPDAPARSIGRRLLDGTPAYPLEAR